MTWVMRHVNEQGLWGVTMSGQCPWCSLQVDGEKVRHGHWLNPYNGQPYPSVASAASLGLT